MPHPYFVPMPCSYRYRRSVKTPSVAEVIAMDYFSGWCKSERRLDNITAIITGANTGIGKETARDFYKRGARIIMACRNMEKAAAAKSEIEASKSTSTGTLILEHLDLCSLKSVQKFAERVLANEARLNILVNNAGVMCCPESRTEDGFETHIGSNFFGHALLTLLLLPRIIQSGISRIVFVSSAIHYFYKIDLDDINFEKTPYEPLEAYSKSKIADIMFVRALALLLKKNNIQNVTTYSLHPGIVYTDIDQHYKDTAWFWVTYFFRSPLLTWMWKSPLCGAQTTIYCAVDEECAKESGLYYSDCAVAPPSSYCQRDDEAIRLWDLTIKNLKLQDYDAFNIS